MKCVLSDERRQTVVLCSVKEQQSDDFENHVVCWCHNMQQSVLKFNLG